MKNFNLLKLLGLPVAVLLLAYVNPIAAEEDEPTFEFCPLPPMPAPDLEPLPTPDVPMVPAACQGISMASNHEKVTKVTPAFTKCKNSGGELMRFAEQGLICMVGRNRSPGKEKSKRPQNKK